MNPRALHSHVHSRFREVFGSPHNTLAQAAQWTLGSTAAGPPVHVLLNGAGEQTSVWVFDPYDDSSAPPAVSITEPDQVDGAIAQILRVLNRRPVYARAQSAAALLSHPTRISGFVRGVHGWSDCITVGSADAARLETEKARIFGRFLIEDKSFADAYRRNRQDHAATIDRHEALTGMCSFLNAVADLVAAGPQPDPA